METSAVLLTGVACVLAGLVVGAALGAWLVFARLRATWQESAERAREEAQSARSELAEVQAALAAAEAESRVLTAERSADRDRTEAESKVLTALAPVDQRLQTLQRQVGMLERDRVEQYGQLSEQLKTAAATDSALLVNTRSLVATLKSTSARGHWGEVQLRRVVEAAGMLPHTDFDEQQVLRGDEEQILRPDLVVRLPGGKSLAVDAKAPLAAVLEAEELAGDVSAEAASRRRELQAAHAKAVRAHVDALSAKEYWQGLPDSPEMVLCFLPAESFLASALEADPGLLDHAFSRNVALVAPVSLLAALKSVAYAWRQETLTDNARELFEASRQLYQRLGTLGGHVSKLGGSLRSAVEKYNSLVGTLESRVLPSARRIGDLDPSNGSELEPLKPVESNPRVLSAAELLDEDWAAGVETDGAADGVADGGTKRSAGLGRQGHAVD
ncbi:DNA recombination protein RmuC [Citricoccus sp. GCM10030269]|uniref:DNA recombination protein RmuC n=1 Tax=Citricoccus sp. GCM10030269 TaxID=3273388 RepID=UPI00361604C9